MRRGRTLWTIIGIVVAAVAVVIALFEVNSGTSPKAASSPVPPISAVQALNLPSLPRW